REQFRGILSPGERQSRPPFHPVLSHKSFAQFKTSRFTRFLARRYDMERMSAKSHRSRPRNPHPRPSRSISPGRQSRGRKKLVLWLTIAAFAGVIVYARSGLLRARKTAAPPAASASATASPAARVAGPRIQFASTVYDF